ncbi:MAG: hypothetical protein IKE93_09915 [Erysipelotrichaceae bacterium]|nr:hypothetical protein [Erysipelotrichaceae bacterium]MBR2702217.1 hypothetical protein [Erysipelotrichaceae bacterium]MBR2745784.1 hypothetical protein [Erysipelotrichaceae bacterium]
MTFKNVKEGLKQLRTGELLILLTIFTGLVLSVAGTIGQQMQKAGNTEAYNKAMTIAAIGLIATMLITALGNVLKVLGVLKASKDGGKFSTALVFAALNVALSLAGTFFTKNNVVSDGIRTATSILDVFTTYFVVNGILEVAERIGNSDLKNQCNKSIFYILRAEVCSVIVQLIGIFMKKNDTLTTIASIIGVVALVLSLISYIVYLKLLKKATKVL